MVNKLNTYKMKTATAIKPLPANIEKYVSRQVGFNMFGLLNLSILRAETKTTLSTKELKERIMNRFSDEMVNGKIQFIGYDKYEMREVKGRGDSYFEIFDADTEKTISDNFISKNIPKGYGKVKNQFIKSRKKYEFVLSHKNGVFFTKLLNDNHKKQKK